MQTIYSFPLIIPQKVEFFQKKEKNGEQQNWSYMLTWLQ